MMNTTQKPNIRSLPGKNYYLTKEDLEELRIRQQAVLFAKTNFMLMQQGFNGWLHDLTDRYGFDGDNFMISMVDGAIQERPAGVE